jgi:hypothetical protein
MLIFNIITNLKEGREMTNVKLHERSANTLHIGPIFCPTICVR